MWPFLQRGIIVYVSAIFTSGLLQSFSTVSEELGIKIQLKHKKINISNPRVSNIRSKLWGLNWVSYFLYDRSTALTPFRTLDVYLC